VAALLRTVEGSFEAHLDPAMSPAWRGLDVNRLGVALGRLGVGESELASSGRLGYHRDPHEAVAQVVQGSAAAAFLLDPPPVDAITRVAAAGETMPQKSTYFEPKAPTGLVFGPLEW
jgi:uncharacterized protein (DUF1015 family)